MPTGSSPKREREFSKLKTEFKKEHRYSGREEEVAAKIVNKQRKEAGETKDAQATSSKSTNTNAKRTQSRRTKSSAAKSKST